MKNKKVWLIIFAAIIVFYFIGSNSEKENKPVATEKQTEEKPKKEEPKEVEREEVSKVTEINQEYAFAEFKLFVDQVKTTDKETEITFRWLNQAAKGKKQFMNLAIMEVTQDGKVIEDVKDSWNIENKNTSPIYFPNAENGEYKFTMTYKTTEPLTVTVIGLADGHKEKIEIN